tara:strand:+ start:3305 stop:3541 length:237 start_codon:yes stop_codon:yes gene_type:complete
MSLLSKFKNGVMTILSGITNNNGTDPTSLPQPNLNPNAFKNPNGSVLDIQDSGPINVPDNKHKQNFTPGNKYMNNLPQ